MNGIIMSLLNGTKGYKVRKAQKAQIKKDLMPIVWHPSRWSDMCVTEEEKRDTNNCGSNR